MILQAKNELIKKMTNICNIIDVESDMYLGDIMEDCISAISVGNFITAPLQLRKLGNILDKRGLFHLAEEVDSLLPEILELKSLIPNTNLKTNNSLSAQKAFKTAMKLNNMYLCGDVDEKSFEYEKMKELEFMLKSGFSLPSDVEVTTEDSKNWWDYFQKKEVRVDEII